MSQSSASRGVHIIEALIASGVADIVAAPGSRSAPLLLAAADAERQGLVRLHVRIDERSAGFLALGLARMSGTPVAILTTSGTAAVNLHPAMVEAAYLGIPVVAVTADRPSLLRGSGANQTIDQRALFGVDAPTVDLDGHDPDEVDTVRDAVLASCARHRPLHLNVAFEEPLVEAGHHRVTRPGQPDRGGLADPPGQPDRGGLADPPGPEVPTVRAPSPLMDLAPGVDLRRGLVIVGDGPSPQMCAEIVDLAEALGWPIISEPSGNLTATDHSLRHGPLVLGTPEVLDSLLPEVVLTVGRVGLHRSVMRVLRGTGVHIAIDVPPYLGRVDPARTATIIIDAVPTTGGPSPDDSWMRSWRAVDGRIADRVSQSLDDSPLSGPVVARTLAGVLDSEDLLVVGPSWPIRHVSEFAGPIAAHCLANRGTSGIDGVVSTAWGAALAHRGGGTTYALVGDLTALYDRNGLLTPRIEERPRLVYVVIDNDGGGIFGSLEQGAEEFSTDFERVFGTPLGVDLEGALSAPGVAVETVVDAEGLRDALRTGDGVRVVIARCVDRQREKEIADLART